MPKDYRDISSAPRDGTLIEVTDFENGRYEMRWNSAGYNPLVSEQHGLWEAKDGSFTWCEDYGFGPTHWRPASPAQTETEGGVGMARPWNSVSSTHSSPTGAARSTPMGN